VRRKFSIEIFFRYDRQCVKFSKAYATSDVSYATEMPEVAQSQEAKQLAGVL